MNKKGMTEEELRTVDDLVEYVINTAKENTLDIVDYKATKTRLREALYQPYEKRTEQSCESCQYEDTDDCPIPFEAQGSYLPQGASTAQLG